MDNNSVYKRELNLIGFRVFLDEEALFHIINRHYGELTKPYNSSKSYHLLDFDMDYLHLDIQNIFNLVEKSGLKNNVELKSVIFQYKNVVYIIVLEDLDENKKRIKTFYPIDGSIKLNEIEQNNDFVEFSKDLGLYVKK